MEGGQVRQPTAVYMSWRLPRIKPYPSRSSGWLKLGLRVSLVNPTSSNWTALAFLPLHPAAPRGVHAFARGEDAQNSPK